MKKVAGIIILLIGLFLFLLAANNINKIKELSKYSEETTAKVYLKLDEAENMSVYHPKKYTLNPIVEYKVGDEIITTNNDFDKTMYKLFDNVKILYNSNDVHDYIFKDNRSSIIYTVILILFGIFFIIIGLFYLLKRS